MQVVLITGGAGFIGSNFIPYFLENNKAYKVVNLDLLTYAGDLSNVSEIQENSRHTFIHGDICDKKLVENLFNKYQFSAVIHFAAESHVDNSITKPDAFVKTNVLGTFNLLDTAKNYWMESPKMYKKGFENCRFHHISTDEVYGTLGETGLFTEKTPYAPNSPYSASKASSDFMVRSYFHTYGMNVVTTNCSNNYGKKQHDEKLIPTIIRKAVSGEKIPIYGDGKNIREWIHADDNSQFIWDLIQSDKTGVYNIGSGERYTNLQIIEIIEKILGYQLDLKFVQDRKGHDRAYGLRTTLKPKHNLKEYLKNTLCR